jgi:hypothetical protein
LPTARFVAFKKYETEFGNFGEDFKIVFRGENLREGRSELNIFLMVGDETTGSEA